MLTCTEISLRRGTRLLFEGVSFTLHAGQKVGVTGANGSGKSSLFALIRGELHPDSGALSLTSKLAIAHVAQETPALDTPAIEYVMEGDPELHALQAELAQAQQVGDGVHQAHLLDRLEAIDGYTARARAAQLLHGLGFTPAQEETPVHAFSGGWRIRLNLAQALMCRSEVLLLDEPTNHLDLDAVIWLEDWLRAYPGMLLLISHDRDFLDRVVHHIAHIEHQRMRLYAGNYSDFEVQRAAALAQQQAAHARQQREIVHIRHFVDRFRAKATKARQAQSRLKALARMELIAPAHVDSPFHFTFAAPDKLSNPLLSLNKVQAGYAPYHVVLDRVSLSLAPGDRVGLLGRNGAGKSTLIKLLAGELGLFSGHREPSPDLRVGYFAQHQLEQLQLEDSPLAHLRRISPEPPEQELRDFLGGFGFLGEMALAPVAPFSGGEKARLVLALLVYQRPNLLLLDEPTNHLDLEMRHALNLALQDFTGAMVLVSHDRHLLRSVTDRWLLVAARAVQPFEGDLDDYRQWLTGQRRLEKEGEADKPDAPHSATVRKERRRQEAEQRRRLQPLRQEVQRLEQALERLSTEQATLKEQLTDPRLYEVGAKEQLKALLIHQARADQALSETEEAWLAASEALEAAEQKA